MSKKYIGNNSFDITYTITPNPKVDFCIFIRCSERFSSSSSTKMPLVDKINISLWDIHIVWHSFSKWCHSLLLMSSYNGKKSTSLCHFCLGATCFCPRCCNMSEARLTSCCDSDPACVNNQSLETSIALILASERLKKNPTIFVQCTVLLPSLESTNNP